MNDKRDFDRAVDRWLDDGSDATPPEIIEAVLLAARSTPQERDFRILWRTSPMTYLRLAAVVAVVAVAGIAALYAFGSGPNVGSGPTPEPTATPEPSIAEPSPSADAILPEGPFAWFEPTVLSEPRFDVPPITVTIPASGWSCLGEFRCTLWKGDEVESDDVPAESAMITTSTTRGILVYEDPCQWEYNLPDPALTTADEIAAALAAQPSRDASDPVDVTVGGYPGKVITLHVPDDAGFTDAGAFTDCFRGLYASYTFGDHDADGTSPTRSHQGPGQIDTFWIIEVDDAIVIIDAMYRADTPADRIEEMRSIAESATFE
jgi:hypothetical protein